MGYDLFSQLQGPQIDTNLFGNSTTAGINAGNALPTPFTAGVQGLIKGIGQGQAIQENYQQSEIRQHQIDQQPVADEQQQAQLENEQAQASINQSKAKLQSATESLQLQQEEADLKNKANNAQTALDDTNSIKALQEQLTANPIQAATDISDPKTAAALVRNPEAGQQIIAGLKAAGVPDDIYKDLNATINGAIEAKADIARRDFLTKARERASAKQEADGQDAIYKLHPHLGGLDNDPKFDYGSVKVVGNSRINNTGFGSIVVNPAGSDQNVETKGYSLVQSDPKTGNIKVLQSYDSAEEANRVSRNLEDAKAYTGTVAPIQKVQAQGDATATDGGKPATAGAKGDTNQTIAQQVAARNQKARAQAVASGNGGAYNDLVTRGSSLVKSSPLPNVVNQSQSTPVPPSQAAITRPAKFPGTIGGVGNVKSKASDQAAANGAIGTGKSDKEVRLDNLFNGTESVPTDQTTAKGGTWNGEQYTPPKVGIAGTDSMASIDQHVSNLLGIPNAKVNVNAPPPTFETIARVSSIKALDGYSPVIRGMVTVESGGNPLAYNRGSGAQGLLQMTAPARQDEHLTDAFDAEKNIAAGASFFQKRMDEVSKAITVASGKQGVPIQPDIRMALASFNGGQKYILDGIRKGYTTWDQMKEYIASVKTDAATKENLAYPDKVLAATIPFMKGGNQADDNLMKQFLAAGIVEINPLEEV